MKSQSKITIGATTVGLCLSIASVAFAQGTGISNPLSFSTFPALLQGLVVLIGDLVVGISTIALIISAILFLLAAGDPGKLQTAKNAFTYAILGLFIGMAASTIVGTLSSIGKTTTMAGIIKTLTTQLGDFIAVLGSIMLIVSGIFFLFSFGNPNIKERAKRILIYSIIGIALGLGINVIISFVQGIFK